mgnify:CR=1 FL=1
MVHQKLFLRSKSIKLFLSLSLISQLIITFIFLGHKNYQNGLLVMIGLSVWYIIDDSDHILGVHLKFRSTKVFIRCAQGNLMSSSDRRKHPNDDTKITSGLTILKILRLHYYIFLDIRFYFQNISLLEKSLQNRNPILIQIEI